MITVKYNNVEYEIPRYITDVTPESIINKTFLMIFKQQNMKAPFVPEYVKILDFEPLSENYEIVDLFIKAKELNLEEFLKFSQQHFILGKNTIFKIPFILNIL